MTLPSRQRAGALWMRAAASCASITSLWAASRATGKRAKPDIADYVLVYRNHKLAVVEAKAWEKPLTEGVGQAKSYAGKLAVRYAYSTNGQGIYGIDMKEGTEGEVAQYPSPEELWNRTFAEANAWRDRFADGPF